MRAQKVKAGECQIALSPKPQDLADAKNDKSLAIVQTPAFMTAFVALNTQKKPLDNQKVRAALNMAFDRTTYLKTVFDNTATPATNPYPPNTWSYNRSIKGWPYDPVKAKKLLADAGYPNGFETTIWVRPNGSVLNPNPKAGAELLQADFAKIGVKADVKVIEWGELIKQAKQGQHDFAVHGLGRRQRRSGQLSVAALQLQCGEVGDQLRALLRSGSGQADRRRQGHAGSGQAHESV